MQNKLKFFEKVCSGIQNIANDVQLHVITNVESNQKEEILNIIKKYIDNFYIHVPILIGHPYSYTWSHFEIFRKLLRQDDKITHFLYLEDDIYLKKSNFLYWINGRAFLKKYGFYPSFLRYEFNFFVFFIKM